MYRQSYSEQQVPSSMNNQMGAYDFRNPGPLHYKQNSLESINPSFHQPQHQLYYETQQISGPPLDQSSYHSMIPVQSMDTNYDMQRYYWREMEGKLPDSYAMSGMTGPGQGGPQYLPAPPNIVHRISGIIRSQLPSLQAIMVQVSSIYNNSRVENNRPYSRSSSREKQTHRKESDSSHDWLCRKCSFSNYDWRDFCKKCKESRPMRNFVPGPEDWRCPKCSNINYARRMECNRCKRPKTE